jgi:hypothetical protein
MLILLDECIDRRFAKEIQGHVVKTVPEMGWANFKNGHLLRIAQQEFDVFITIDRHLPYQQNISRLSIAVIVLQAKTNRLADLQPLVPLLQEMLPTAPIGTATYIRL